MDEMFSEDILSQEEIDELLKSIRDGKICIQDAAPDELKVETDTPER